MRRIVTISLIILFCAGCSRPRHVARGYMLGVARAPETCGDSRNFVAIAIGENRARLNIQPDGTIVEVVSTLREVMSYRAEKLLYVKADAGVSWGEFVQLLDHVWPEADVVSILTPQVEALARQRWCLSPSCGECVTLRHFRPL